MLALPASPTMEAGPAAGLWFVRRWRPVRPGLLRHRLHWRLQRPARRAIERDEQAITRWVAEDWP